MLPRAGRIVAGEKSHHACVIWSAVARAERRSRIVQSTITVAGLLVVLGLGSLWMIPPQAAVAEACCQDVHDMAEQYVHHELDPEMTARIERHLHDCPRCQQYVDSLAQRLRNALSWIWRHPESDRSLQPLGNEQNPLLAVRSTIQTG